MGALQPGHLILILVIVLVVFGPGKLPELGKALGEGLRELKHATDSGDAQASAKAGAASATTLQSTTTAPAQAEATRPCPSCNAAVPVSDKFCGGCGQPVSAPAATKN